MNPQLLVSMPHVDTVIISLQQMDMTHVIGISVYKVSSLSSLLISFET